MNFLNNKNKIKFFYLLSPLIISIISIVLGIKFLFEPIISLSLYRSILFGYSPIAFGIIIISLKINYKIIVVNTCFLFLLGIIIFEIILISSEKNIVSNAEYNIYPPHIGCGGINAQSPTNYKYIENLKIYPLSGKSYNIVSLKNTLTNKITKDQTDNYGFKNSFNWNSRSSFDNIFIGDSFTYGTDVAHGESFPEIVGDKFPSTLNLGCGGTGSIMQFGIFLEYVKILKPKFVIWNFYSGNDLNSDIPTEHNSFYKKYLENGFSQDLISQQKTIDEIHEKTLSILKSKLFKNKTVEENNIFTKFNEFYKFKKLKIKFGLQYSFSPHSLEMLKKILIKANQDTESWNGNFVFVFIPTLSKYTNQFHGADHDGYYIHLIKFLLDEKIRFINFGDELIKYDNPRKFYSGHLNHAGNKLLAKLIINYMIILDEEIK